MLGRRSRLLAAACGLAAFAAAYATTPLSARDGGGARPEPGVLAAASLARADDSMIQPRRDPFAYGDERAPSPAPETAHAPGAAAIPPIPAMIGPLPANAGARGDGAPPPFRVAALVTGAHPYALVEEGAAMRLVAPGDPAGGSIVDAIETDGVHLRSGAIVPPGVRPGER